MLDSLAVTGHLRVKAENLYGGSVPFKLMPHEYQPRREAVAAEVRAMYLQTALGEQAPEWRERIAAAGWTLEERYAVGSPSLAWERRTGEVRERLFCHPNVRCEDICCWYAIGDRVRRAAIYHATDEIGGIETMLADALRWAETVLLTPPPDDPDMDDVPPPGDDDDDDSEDSIASTGDGDPGQGALFGP